MTAQHDALEKDSLQNVSSSKEFLAEFLSWAGIVVPIALVFVTALIRSIVRRNQFFSGENLYLGIDLSFAGLAATSVEVLDALRQHVLGSSEGEISKVVIGLALAFGSFVILLVVTKLHQSWDRPCPKTTVVGRVLAERDQKVLEKQHTRKQIIWLGIASNGAGFATIAVFAWLRARKLV